MLEMSRLTRCRNSSNSDRNRTRTRIEIGPLIRVEIQMAKAILKGKAVTKDLGITRIEILEMTRTDLHLLVGQIPK